MFIERSPEIDQKGIYGTGSAVKILSLGAQPTQEETKLMRDGESWLTEEWVREDSRTSEKIDQAIIYKHIYTVFGLRNEHDGEFNYSLEDCLSELWHKRVDEGWGEFHYPAEIEADRQAGESKILPSAFALIVLAQSTTYVQKAAFVDSLLSLATKSKEHARLFLEEDQGDKAMVAVKTALTVLALSRYVTNSENPDPKVLTELERTGKQLERLISNMRGVGPHSYVHYQFTAPRPKTRRSRYILLLHNPIICQALIAANQVDGVSRFAERNWRYLTNSIRTYVDAIHEESGLDSGKYRSSKTNLSFTGDHLWIAELIQEFQKLDTADVRLRSMALGELRRASPVGAVFIVIFVITAGLGGTLTLDIGIWREVVTGIILAVSSAAFAQAFERFLS